MEPLPPVKEVEYRCYIGKVFEELSGTEFITFAFETAKEFSSFRYEIAVRYRIQPGLLEFKVLGMTATRTMMPAFGTARSVLKVPLLPYGIYNVKLIKSDDTENMFTIEVSKKGFQILLPIPRKRFIDLIIEDKAAAPLARHLSTISKTPPMALVPRTIQKRAPGLLDGDPDILEADEDHDPQEDDALFEETPKLKSGAKHAIEEIEEVPTNVKPKSKAKAEPKPAKAPKAAIEKAHVAKEKKTNDKPAKAAKKPAVKAKPIKPAKKTPAKKKPAPKPKAKAKPAKKSGKKK